MARLAPATRLWFVAASLCAALALGACDDATSSIEQQGIVPPVAPAAPDFSTPQRAVKSYTDWISYAYRVMDSDVATHTFGPQEEIRVNSYVVYNIQEGRGLEQNLNESEYRIKSSTADTATVVGKEYWGYRYFALDQSKYLTGPLKASYDVTYTVTRQPDGRWLVQKVDVTRLDPLPTSE